MKKVKVDCLGCLAIEEVMDTPVQREMPVCPAFQAQMGRKDRLAFLVSQELKDKMGCQGYLEKKETADFPDYPDRMAFPDSLGRKENLVFQEFQVPQGNRL